MKVQKLKSPLPEDLNKDQDLRRALKNAVIPEPNSAFLGMHIGLWAHYKVQAKKDGFISRYLERKYGEEPVYLSSVNFNENEKLLINRLENRGYFFPDITFRSAINGKKARAVYSVEPGRPYALETYQYQSDSGDAVDQVISDLLVESDLQPGQKFNLDKLKSERRRIDKYLKEHGYFYFSSKYLTFTTDTNQYPHRGFDLYLRLIDDAPRERLKPYRLGKVSVYSNIEHSGLEDIPDSSEVNGIKYFQNPEWVQSEYIDKQIVTVPDSVYRLKYAQATSRRLSSLGAYQHANVRFSPSATDSSDTSDLLDAKIFLTPAKKFNIRTGMHGFTKSTGFAGPGLVVNFQNRNFLKGAEVLEIVGTLGYEFQISRGTSRGLNNFELRLENSLIYPRLLAPWIRFNKFRTYSVPNTRIKLNFNFQQRALYYSLNNFYTALSYDWYSNPKVRWEATPLSLNYMHVFNKTEDFLKIIAGNPFLARSFDDQLIPATSIGFQYSELNDLSKVNRLYLSINLEQAGFLTRIISPDDSILGLPFAQYVKADIDFRHNMRISREHRLVNRVFVGLGMPYGNSASLPYIKQYFSGGPNSVRAFLVRSLGPGGFVPQQIDNSTFFDQAGDIRLEFNSEYRFPILGYLKGALFIDAGNIWLTNDNPSLPGGQFTSEWFRQLAVGTGVGLRFDAQVLIVRLDVAHAIKYPSKEFREFWESDPRLGGLVWNFAIGYPF